MGMQLDPALTGQTGGPAGGQPINPTGPALPSPLTSAGGTGSGNPGYQSFVDSTLASLGYRSLRDVPDARAIQALAQEAQRAKELETKAGAKETEAQQLAAQKAEADAVLARERFRNQKIMTLATINPALIPLVDSIVVPEGADAAAISAAATSFLESLKTLGFSPTSVAQAAVANPTQPVAGNQPPAAPLPPAPGIPPAAPPAGQLGTIDERIKGALSDMWEHAGKDPAKYFEAEKRYFAGLKEKERVEGWVDTKWGRPPGMDRDEV